MGDCIRLLRYRTSIKMVQRLTYRRRLSYNTPSNQRRIVRTPGGKLVYQYKKKPRQIPKCGTCKCTLRGIKPGRAHERKRMSLREKKVLPCVWWLFVPHLRSGK